MKFPELWYESNACWGNIESIEDLNEKLKLQLAENNSIKNIDDFLDKSTQSKYSDSNFGTRREHTKDYTLRNFLKDNDLLDAFICSNQAE